MSDEAAVVHVRDLFAYVDTYRRLKVESADTITKQKEKLVEKFWNMQDAPTRYWAELRAHEHALDWVLRRKEPELVVFGETDADGKPKESSEIKTLRQERTKMREENHILANEVARMQKVEAEYQGQLVQKNQEMARLKRRYEQTISTYIIISITLSVVVLILFGVLTLR